MSENDKRMSTAEFSAALRKIDATLEAQRVARHAANNHLQHVLGKITLSVEELGERHDGLLGGVIEKVTKLTSQYATIESTQGDIMIALRGEDGDGGIKHLLTVIDHIVRGVDGKNGMRGDVKIIKDRMRFLEIRAAALAAVFGGIGYWIGYAVAKL